MRRSKSDPKQIGLRLKALRGYEKQMVVAKAVGISTQALSMYERGKRIPCDAVKVKIANYYHVTVQSVFYA